MANPSKGLGRGLAALLGDDVMTPEEEKTSLYLPISQVESCASQPRKQFDPDALADLADSIRIEHTVYILQILTTRISAENLVVNGGVDILGFLEIVEMLIV